jgi:molybdopterin-guanine dinucleotide biosynthesis protein MobB
MTQSKTTPPVPIPFIVSVAGLKKSGKTTVVEALLSELRRRGKRVSSIKKMEHAALYLDPEGTDTRRHAEAGADVVVAMLGAETVRFERVTAPISIQSIAPLFPRNTDFLVSEGIAERALPQLVIVCLRSSDDWNETISVRNIEPGAVCAVSGVVAAGLTPGAAMVLEGIPVYDVTDALQRSALGDLVMKKACPDVES